jgi:hypothetical protein
MLRNIASGPLINYTMRKLDLLERIKNQVNTFFLNEIEIAVWSLYLDATVWKTANTTTLDNDLLYSAFAAKSFSLPG